MKIKNNGHDSWEIYNDEKVVGRIETYHGFSRNTKSLYVNDKKIIDIKNQNEAIEKLKDFFNENKNAIKLNEELIEQLSIGMKQVEHQVCIDALEKERARLFSKVEQLKSYDLI